MIDYADLLPNYPDISDPLFQQKIYDKEEFYSLKLNKEQEKIARGEFLNHQLVVARYLSEHTPYNGALLFHEMGTGKTCASFALTEALKKSKIYRRCLVFARGRDLLTNLMKNFVFSCSTEYNIDKKANPKAQIMQIRKQLKTFYTFNTFLTFAREIKKLTDEQITRQYSNMIFIVDEIHNIKGKDLDQSVYLQFHRLFHLTENCKILLMTGTPMTDDVSELANTMNLILPADQQLPTGANFVNKFMILQEDGTYEVNPAHEAELKTFLRGRISFLKADKGLDIVYEGEPIRPSDVDIPQFRVTKLQMSKFQMEAYAHAFAEDTSEGINSIYNNSRQASLFVFPDGSWGKAGEARYTTGKDMALNRELVPFIYPLENLQKLSVKYAENIRLINKNPMKNIYIYSSVVNGSGVKLFSKILEYYGFSQCRGGEVTKGKRYILLTGATQGIERLLEYYNHPQNCQGEYCQVLIGSKKIAEGFTFKNIQIEMMDTFHWNYTETSQALKRATRFRSHLALEEKLGHPIPVRVIQPASIPQSAETSIDCRMMIIARRKDITFKRMERVCQECSFDCPINYERNVGDVENSRDCNYQKCEYTCDTSSLVRRATDISTYELYYSNFMDLVPRVSLLFRERDSVLYATIRDLTAPVDDLQLLKCLAYIIETNVVLLNRYRYACYLREEDSLFFLVASPSVPLRGENLSSKYGRYVTHPTLTQVKSLEETMVELEVGSGVSVLDDLLSNPPSDAKGFNEIVQLLPTRIRDMFIRLAIEKVLRDEPSRFARYILLIFEELIYFPTNSEYSAIYESDDGAMCAKPQGAEYVWVKCRANIPVRTEKRVAFREEKEPSQEEEEEEQEFTIPQGTKYVGVVQGDKFCIQDLSKTGQKDKRFRTTGAVCVEAGWKKVSLIDMANELNIQGNAWTKKTKAQICELIRKHLDDKGLVRRGKCGTSRKTKN